jgi:hypothetical protein
LQNGRSALKGSQKSDGIDKSTATTEVSSNLRRKEVSLFAPESETCPDPEVASLDETASKRMTFAGSVSSPLDRPHLCHRHRCPHGEEKRLAVRGHDSDGSARNSEIALTSVSTRSRSCPLPAGDRLRGMARGIESKVSSSLRKSNSYSIFNLPDMSTIRN